ncbi:MAG: hypothetical protein IAE79_06915 [Anaerolinea sp.]|nr:hypothetical protein [Anaerolinea sp.]
MDDHHDLREIMFAGAIGGASALCLLFALIGTISYIAWPAIIPIYHPYIDFVFLHPPIWHGTIIGGAFGLFLGWFWGLMDRDVGATTLNIIGKPDCWQILWRILVSTMKLALLVCILGILLTSAWL